MPPTRIAEDYALLNTEQLSEIKPYRVRIIAAGSHDAIESLTERSIQADFALDRFQAFNGLSGDVELGDRLKLISEE